MLGAVGFSLSSASLTWRTVQDVGQLDARHENAFIEVGGTFYLLGGRGNRRLEMFDPSDSTWTQGAFPPGSISLHHFQAVAIGTTIYVLGAYTNTFPDEDTVTNIYTYDTTTDTWATGPAIPLAFQRGSAGAAVYNGKIYVVGGSVGGHGASSVRVTDFSEYDPNTDTWTALPDAPRARDHFHAAVLDGKLYVAGGRDGSQGNTVPEVDVYTFATGTWSTLGADLPTPRGGSTSVPFGHYVVVIGGETAQQLAHDEVEALDVFAGSWLSLNPLVTGRHGTQAIAFDDNLYIAAGSGEKGGGPELNTMEVFETDGETNLPVELAPTFAATVDAGSVVLTWQTLSETNNAAFDVQRLVDGAYRTIGTVEGAGTTTIRQAYAYRVEGLPPGRHQFRLRQVDFDGGFDYSPEVSVLLAVDGAFYLSEVYPNPFNPEARFALTVPREQHVRVEVYDMLGRPVTVIYDGMLLPQEPQVFALQATDWAGGRYVLRVTGTFFAASRLFTLLK